MKALQIGLILALTGSLVSCFSRTEKSPEPVPKTTPRQVQSAVKEAPPKKDRTLEIFAKYFEQADAIHREAWWVLTADRRPAGRSPFGKAQRGILSSQNIKLANKSLFRCDRYIVQRDVLGANGFPQKTEIYEKCSEKQAAKKIVQFYAPSILEVQATFYPENLEEILGLGATVLNRSINCTLKGNDREQLESLKCTDWAQDRNKEQMIRLDVYDYERAGKNLIKLRGKVYENLSDTRKIEADVPLEGKIYVKETELYPPEPTPAPTPTKAATAKPRPSNAPPLELPAEGAAVASPAPEIPPARGTVKPLPPPLEGAVPLPVDPDVLMMQQNQQQMQESIQEPHIENGEIIEGVPPSEGEVPPAPVQDPAAGGVYGR